MSQKTVHLLVVLALIFIFSASNKYSVNGQQYTATVCRQQCDGAYQFYRRFVNSEYFLNNYYNQCIRRCPQSSSTYGSTRTTRTTTTTTTTTTTPRWSRNLDCGIQTNDRNRIVGGIAANYCEYPWMVGVSVNTVFCGGAILDKRHILTAAHCMRDRYTRVVAQPSQVLVRVGSSQLSRLRTYRVLRVNSDPRHVPVINDYDVAVLTLEEDLEYGYCVAPICLPNAYEDARNADFCVAAGWGIQDFYSSSLSYDLQKVELPIVDQNACRNSYGSRYVNDLKICAGDFNRGGIDTCQGDSGGPLMCKVSGRYVVFGIVSFGSGCARPQYPGIYTRVANPTILNFITSATRDYYK